MSRRSAFVEGLSLGGGLWRVSGKVFLVHAREGNLHKNYPQLSATLRTPGFERRRRRMNGSRLCPTWALVDAVLTRLDLGAAAHIGTLANRNGTGGSEVAGRACDCATGQREGAAL
jgi:hypothetical protein